MKGEEQGPEDTADDDRYSLDDDGEFHCVEVGGVTVHPATDGRGEKEGR
jgi:hypothetical protein